MAQIVHTDPTLLLAEDDNVLFAVWTNAPTIAQMNLLGTHGRSLVKKHGKFALWDLIVRGTPNFTSEVRDALRRLTEDPDQAALGTAHVVIAPGLVGAAARAFVSTMILVSRKANKPTKVFSNEREAAVWLHERGARLTVDALLATSTELASKASSNRLT